MTAKGFFGTTVIIAIMLAAPALATHLGWVAPSGTHLLVNGTTDFYYAGTNNYYLWYKPLACGTDEGCVREVLDDAAAMNLTVIRTWGFGDGTNGGGGWNGYYFQPSARTYDEATFAHFDQVINESHARGIRLIIPLVNNWNDFGGMQQYVTWCGGTVHDDFYTNSECKSIYKDYVRYFLNRTNTITGIKYKDDPTILAWELANEPRAQTAGVATLNSWISEMAGYIRSLDANHMISTGSEGFYNGRTGFTGWMYDGSQGVDFIASHNNTNISYASFHSYPDSWGQTYSDMMDWTNVHVDDARYTLGKPVIAGEYGKKPNSTRDDYYRDWQTIFEQKHANGDNFWILYNDAYTNYDDFGVYYPNGASVSLFTAHANVMKVKTSQASSADQVAQADIAVSGTVAGNFTHTRTDNSVNENITEILSGGNPSNRYSYLEHKWRYWATRGTGAVTFKVNAYHTANSENDHFVFAYSTDDATYTDMVTVTNTSDTGQYLTYALPSSVKGKIWIRVRDTDRTAGNQVLDTLRVDHMLITSDGINLSVPDYLPTVDIITPTAGATVSGMVDVNATASDDHAVSTVEYKIDAGSYTAMTLTGGIWTAQWNSSGASGGQHTITVRATDDVGQTSTDTVGVTVDHYPSDADPTVDILAPANGSTVNGTVLINASATDDVSVSSVDYKIDAGSWNSMTFNGGTYWSANWNSSTVGDGNHDITVRSTDSVGQTTSKTITVNVDNVVTPALHVQDIAMSAKKVGSQWQASASILIRDQNGAAVSGASVTTNWSGAGGPKTETVTTNSTGHALSYSNKASSGTFTVTVANVSKSGYIYDSAANVETTDSITV